MGLTKRKDGWYVEFRVIDDDGTLRLNPYGKVKRWRAGVRKEDAKNQESTIKTQLVQGIVKTKKEQRKEIPFSIWGEQYLTLTEVRNLRSYRDRVGAIQKRLIPFFGNTFLSKIQPSDIAAYRSQRIQRNGKPAKLQTVNYDHAILKHVLSVAQSNGHISHNPAKDVKIPDPKNERDRILTQEEWMRLLQVSPPHLVPIILTANHTGMRLREILTLTWDRVDMKKGVIRLRKEDTKNRDARTVPMDLAVKQSFEGLWKNRVLYTNRVFLYQGKSIKEVKSSFETACRKAGISNFRFHDFRHCAVTNLRRAGVDLTTAMAIVGHKSEKMWNRYNKIEEEDLTRAALKLNTLITLTPPSHQTQTLQSI